MVQGSHGTGRLPEERPSISLGAVLAVNATLFLVVVLGMELVFGGWLDSSNLNRLNIRKDCRLSFDVSDLYEVSDPLITYSRDRYGLRGSHRTPAEIDVLTVGGSTTDQIYLRDGDTWQDVLQRRFEASGVDVLVANAGVDGQSTYGHIKNFDWWFGDVDGLSPEYVLFYVGLNDFYKDVGSDFDALIEDDPDFDLVRSIRENSVFWYLAQTFRGLWQALLVYELGHTALDFDDVDWTSRPLQHDYAFMKPRLDQYAARLRILADRTREFGARPIFVSQPTRRIRFGPGGIEGDADSILYEGHEINGVDYYHMLRKLDAVTGEVAAETGVAFVDLGAVTDWVDADFYDFYHMTPQGAEKLGDQLYASLRDVIGTGPDRP